MGMQHTQETVLASGYVAHPTLAEQHLPCYVVAAESGAKGGWYVIRADRWQQSVINCTEHLEKLEAQMSVKSQHFRGRSPLEVFAESHIVFLPRNFHKH
jgi:hypothetical protein